MFEPSALLHSWIRMLPALMIWIAPDEEEVPGLDDDEELDEIAKKRGEQIGLMMVEVARVSRNHPGLLHKHSRSQRVQSAAPLLTQNLWRKMLQRRRLMRSLP